MKICLIGPGIMEIPPKGWGAVEIIIWDIKCTLETLGHSVFIINTTNKNDIITQIEKIQPDFIHIQYDEQIDIGYDLYNKYSNNIALTSYYAYTEQPQHSHFQGYIHIFNKIVGSRLNIISVSEGIKNTYIKYGADIKKMYVVPSGVRTDLFKFSQTCLYPERTIYLAKIDFRKRQYLFQNIKNLYFVGNIADNRFRKENNYLGEWNKNYLYEHLTEYPNLALLSDGEAHPLVCMEALAAGLGVVISECATANLDLTKSFIDVVPESKITDIDYISRIIKENRIKSLSLRNEIREYAMTFDYKNIIKNIYIPTIIKIIGVNN